MDGVDFMAVIRPVHGPQQEGQGCLNRNGYTDVTVDNFFESDAAPSKFIATE
jgi:hypothetical protein